MKRNECRIVRNSIPAYLEGDLPPDALHLVKEHLAACPSCKAEEALFRRSMNALDAFAAAEKKSLTVPEMWDAVALRISAERQRLSWRVIGVRVGAVAAAAVAVGAVMLSLFLPHQNRPAQRLEKRPALVAKEPQARSGKPKHGIAKPSEINTPSSFTKARGHRKSNIKSGAERLRSPSHKHQKENGVQDIRRKNTDQQTPKPTHQPQDDDQGMEFGGPALLAAVREMGESLNIAPPGMAQAEIHESSVKADQKAMEALEKVKMAALVSLTAEHSYEIHYDL
ncbi:MAG: anti-sigma factor family protein [Armatimonadota bacterium]